MTIVKPAIAGTLESSDAMVTVGPNEAGGIKLELISSVYQQYGRQIREVIYQTLKRLDVQDVSIRVVDKGALDCTLRARVECAVFRSNDITDSLPWGGAIRS